jgi:diguanylate cyclase (GGDEF)-like protein
LNEQNNKLAYAQKALQSANGALKKLSVTDGLTQVHNRIYFEEEFRKEWRRCARQKLPISILMIDADHFKQINDSAGHMAGDQCLQAISRKLKQHFKRAGELVARYGGEEFVAMLPNTDQRKTLAVAEGLRSAIERMEFEYNGNVHRVTISIGASTTTPSSNTSPDDLLEAADAALYEAKDRGRNKVTLIPMLPTRPKNSKTG